MATFVDQTGLRCLELLAQRRSRSVLYASLLTVLAGIACFGRLSAGSLNSDEAAFACTTDRMRATGDWVVPYITDEPHLNATPLYNWLTLAIDAAFDDTPLWYRFWSAAFGVGCVLMAFALGTLMFSAEVGLLAGLFLTFNRLFLFYHGARFGGMETMLAFFVTAAVFCYVWQQQTRGRAWPAWCLLGLCIGLAWLSKPPVFGGFFLSGMLLHHFWIRRSEPLAARAGGPALALAAALAVAAPWYLAIWMRLGSASLHTLFIYNSVERALDPAARDFFGCHRCLKDASRSFKLVELALVCAAVCWLWRYLRPQWGLLLLLCGGYFVALSATGKGGSHLWYLYYAFPLFAVVLASLFLKSGPRLAAAIGLNRRSAGLVGAGLAMILLGFDVGRTVSNWVKPGWVYPPASIYERFASDVESGRCHLVLFDFPSPYGTPAAHRHGAHFEDYYYVNRMRRAQRIATVKELQQLLQDGKPAVVLLPSLQWPTPAAEAIAQLGPQTQIAANPAFHYTYPVLTFQGAAAILTPVELADLARGDSLQR